MKQAAEAQANGQSGCKPTCMASCFPSLSHPPVCSLREGERVHLLESWIALSCSVCRMSRRALGKPGWSSA